MQHVFVAGDEPVPGYRLLHEIEGSAFYKVWRVSTPEGAERWWKIIDLVVGNAAIETRTLGLLVRLRHSFVNTLTNFWNLDDGKTLIIESELPIQSLRSLLEERQRSGKEGIPREELLEYIEQAAEGLDFLNRPQHEYHGQQVAIYHRALRPDCLLLFDHEAGLACKVSDFGLSKPVTEEVALHSQGLVNYDYDPPEFFEGQTSSTSDQYSLAIVYYELRTGQMPFHGTMLEQLQARLNDKPDLSHLEEPERSIVRKALSRDASHRFKNCLELIRHLKEGTAPSGAEGAATANTAPAAVGRPTPPASMGIRAPQPTNAGSGAPAWRSPAAAMSTKSPSFATASSTGQESSVTTTPSPSKSGLIFHRPSLEKTSSDETVPLNRKTTAVAQSGTSTTVDTVVPPLSPVTDTLPQSPVIKKVVGRPVAGGDLRSIREHLASTSFSMVDNYTGEKRIPLTWVAIILMVTAMGSIWLTNMFAQ